MTIEEAANVLGCTPDHVRLRTPREATPKSRENDVGYPAGVGGEVLKTVHGRTAKKTRFLLDGLSILR